jgi:hypothetical protein
MSSRSLDEIKAELLRQDQGFDACFAEMDSFDPAQVVAVDEAFLEDWRTPSTPTSLGSMDWSRRA